MPPISIPVTTGTGTSTLVSSLTGTRTVLFGATNADDSAFLEISLNGTTWARIAQLTSQKPLHTTNHAFAYARTVRATGTGPCTCEIDQNPLPAGAPGIQGPRGPGGLISQTTLTGDLTWSIPAKTPIMTTPFQVPASGIVELILHVSALHGNTVGAKWHLEALTIAGSEKTFHSHGHTGTPLDSVHGYRRLVGLTPGANLTAQAAITPTATDVRIFATTTPIDQHATLAVYEG